MKLIINISSIHKGGAEQVATSFINECKQFPNNEYHVFLCGNIGKQLDVVDFPDNFHFYQINERPGLSFRSYANAIRYFNSLEKKINPDCVIATGGHGYWKPKVPIVGGFNIPHYVYPESPYFQKLSKKARLYWKLRRFIHMYFYKRLDAIIVQTDDVKDRLRRLITEKSPIYTVSNTANGHYLEPVIYAAKLPEKNEGEIRLLSLSSYYPHKNLEIIKQVAELLRLNGRNQFKFVVTLPKDKFIKAFGSSDHDMIYNVGPVPVRECPSLYNECDFLFLPTLLECFSASYAEAMLMKKPILTSNLGFAHTVCKDAAIYFDPTNIEDIADKIIALAGNEEKQQAMIQRGLGVSKNFNTAQERAGTFLEICKETVKRKSK